MFKIIFRSLNSANIFESIESPTVFIFYFVCKWDFCVEDQMDSGERIAARTDTTEKKRGEFISSFTVKFISFTLMVHDTVKHNLHCSRKLLQSAVRFILT
jgi:hypothetical protein